MKTQIRKNVFETNSSSTHSICITQSDSIIKFPDCVYFNTGNFGWEYKILDSVNEKASYLYTAIMCLKKSYYYDNKTDKELESESKDRINFIKNALKKYNVESKFELCSKDYYIDHAIEAKEFINAVCSNEERLIKYLFSDKSFILTGNDNDDDCNVDIYVDYEHEEYYKGN